MSNKDIPIHPIYKESVTCPNCRKKQEFENIRHNSYAILESDPDTHTKKIKWSHESYNSINPNYYYIWTCNDCLYTDRIPHFKSSKMNDDDINRFRELCSSLFKTHDRVFDELGTYITATHSDHQKALAQHILYIYILEKSKISIHIYNELGRAYLRTAWLFRDERPPNSANITNIVSGLFTDCFSHYLEGFKLYQDSYNTFDTSIKSNFSELIGLNEDPHISSLNRQLSNFNAEVLKHLKELKKLNQQMLSSHRKTMERFHDSISDSDDTLINTLQLIKFDWKTVPDKEETAILRSNQYYRKAIQLGLHKDSTKQLLQLYQIIAYGYYRSHHYKTLLSYCDSVMEDFQKIKHSLNNIIGAAKRKAMMLDKKVIDAKSSNIRIFEDEIEHDLKQKEHIQKRASQAKDDLLHLQEYIDNFNIIRKKAYNRFQENEFERMVNIIKKSPKLTKTEYLKMIQKERIPESIISKYFNMNMVSELKTI